jgi:hypothetical protein
VELIPESEEVRLDTKSLETEGPMLDVLDLFMCQLTVEVMRDPSHYYRWTDLLSERKYRSGSEKGRDR